MFFHHFVLTKLATSSIRFKILDTQMSYDAPFWALKTLSKALVGWIRWHTFSVGSPFSWHCWATFSRFSLFLPCMASWQPAPANWIAVPEPIPELAPETPITTTILSTTNTSTTLTYDKLTASTGQLERSSWANTWAGIWNTNKNNNDIKKNTSTTLTYEKLTASTGQLNRCSWADTWAGTWNNIDNNNNNNSNNINSNDINNNHITNTNIWQADSQQQ